MPRVRILIAGVPLLLAAVTALSLFVVARISTDQKNEMFIGSIGEPVTLNPIQAADGASSAVIAVVFNGLLKYSADLDVEGDLAESWKLSQQSTFFFASPSDAVQAAANMEAGLTDRAALHLERYRVDGKRLTLELSVPGVSDSQKIAALFGPVRPRPVSTLAVTSPKPLGDALGRFAASFPETEIVRTWSNGNLGEIVFLGDAVRAEKALKEFIASESGSEGLAVEAPTAPNFLAEPHVDFRLREGVAWHDGAPFTSRDVKFTYDALMDDRVASPRKSDYELVFSLETPDERTVRVVYRRPFSPALESWMMGLLPAHILADLPPDQWPLKFNREPVGTGPFKFGDWQTNQHVRVVRNDRYFRGRPHLDAIVFRVLPDQLTLRLAFETRQVDFWTVDPWAVGAFEKDPRFSLFSTPGFIYNYVGWNLRRPMFQDERVRRALAHAVNVDQMIRYIFYGHGVQSTGIYTPEMWFFDPSVKPLAHDPEEAKRLLAEAGWKPGPDGILAKDGQRFTFTLLTNNANVIRSDIATLVQADLKKIGIEAKIEMYEWAVFIKKFVNKGDFDAIVLGWSLGQSSYDQFQIWHSSQAGPEQLNVVGFKSREADQLMEAIRQEYERPEIVSLCGKLQSLIYAQQPYLFLIVPETTSVMWKDAYRVRRPGPGGEWIDEPVKVTKAGWGYYLEWFYRPEYASKN